jgi:branched-subunit amino acid transport protein
MAETGWLMIAGVARGSIKEPARYLRLSPGVQRVLRFAPAAALMAIIAPDMLMLHGELALSLANPRLAGGLAGFAVAATTRSVLGAIAAGMLAFTAVRLVG